MVERRVTPLTSNDPQLLLPYSRALGTHNLYEPFAQENGLQDDVGMDSTDKRGMRHAEVLARTQEIKKNFMANTVICLFK